MTQTKENQQVAKVEVPQTAEQQQALMQSALDAINSKIKNMKVLHDTPYRTGGSFKYSNAPDAFIFDIHKSISLEALLGALGHLIRMAESHDAAIKAIGLASAPVFKWHGYAYEDWVSDFKVRISFLSDKAEMEKLEQAKKSLEPFLSHNQRFATVLTDVMNNLGITIPKLS